MKTKKRFNFLLLVFVSIQLCSCNSSNKEKVSSGGDIMKTDHYERVIILGVDGAGNNYQYANTEAIDAIFSKGATTNFMKTSTPSMSAPCWTSMLHGVVPAKHKITNAIAESTPYQNEEYPSIFKTAYLQNPNLKLASFCNWPAINKGIVEDNINVYKYQNSDDALLVNHLNEYLVQEKPNLVFVQFDSVDHLGHDIGFGPSSSKYIQQLEVIDSYILSVYLTLEENNMLDDTLLILTSDHGGRNFSHGGITDEEKYVFLGIHGKNVVKGEIGQVETRDIAAITTYALGLQNPSSWTAKVPNNLFTTLTETKERPLGQSLNLNPNLISKLPQSVTSYFDFEENYEDIKKNIHSSYSLFENDSYKVAGHSGYGFNTYNGYLKLEDLKLSNNSFSIGMYVEMADIRNDPVLFGNKDWASGRNQGIIISPRGVEKDIKLNIGDGSNRFDATFPYPNNFLEGWTHLLFTFDRQENIICFYANFELIGTCSISEELKNLSLDSAFPYYVGNDSTEKYGYGIPAIIDDLAIFNKALTQEEVLELKKCYE